MLAIVDILEPRADGWWIWEVKSSTWRPDKGPKAIHYWDLAYQTLVARSQGLRVVGSGLILIDGTYRREDGPVEARRLLRLLDVTREVESLSGRVEQESTAMLQLLDRREPPADLPGKRCKGDTDAVEGNRYSDCGHLTHDGHCGRTLPRYWAGSLPRLGKVARQRVDTTHALRIEDLDPLDKAWTPMQRTIIQAVQSGAPFVDRDALSAELRTLVYPIAYIDFEFDSGMAIPRYPHSYPYERIPFQWAMLVIHRPGAEPATPVPFLHLDSTDPRRPFTESLLAALPPTGSIIAHHASAEMTVLKQLATHLGQPLSRQLQALEARFCDTEKITQSGFYHPDQQGSYSIKALAPAILGEGYEDLAIQGGQSALAQWRIAISPECRGENREITRQNLLSYCHRDVVLMHRILERVRSDFLR
jgi:hypothetical protein